MQCIRKYTSAIVASAIFAVVFASAWADDTAPPKVDAALQQLLELEPAQLAAKLAEMRKQAAAKEAEAKALNEKAAAAEAEAKKADALLQAVLAGVKALQTPAPAKAEKAMTAPAGTEKKMAPAMGKTMNTPEPSMAAPSMAAAPPAKEAKADEAKKPTVTFDDNIKAIFRSRCSRCHNNDRHRGGLSLDTYATVMEGASTGEVITPGNPDDSRLFQLASQIDDPKMPPSGDPLSDADLALIRKWIKEGAPQNSGSKVMVAKQTEVKKVPVYVAAEMKDGPPPMPEVPLPAPAAVTKRGVVARSVATSPRAPLVAIGSEKQIILYNLDNYQVIGALPFPEGEIFTMTFSVNGEVLVAAGGTEGHSGIAVLWNVRKGKRIGTYGEAYDTILAADISPDNKMLALGGPSKKVHVYSTTDGKELYSLDAHTDWIYAVKFTPDGEVLATADRAGNLFLWQAANGRPVEQLHGHTGAINDLAYTADSTILASAGDDGTIQLWDTWKYKRIRQINAHSGPVLSVDISAAGEMVSSGRDGLVKRWDLNGKNLATYEKLPDWAYQARFAKNGELVLGGDWNGQVVVWDREKGTRYAALNTLSTAVSIPKTEVAKAN